MNESEQVVRHERARIRLGLALGLLGVIAFSLTLPMARVAVSAYAAVEVVVWRALLAALCAALILLWRRPPRPRGRQWWPLAGCAFGTVFGFPLFTTLGMQSVSASHGAVVVGLLPLATAVVAVLAGGERVTRAFWVASLVGTALTLTFVLRQADGGIALGHVYLALAVVAAAIGYACGGVLARSLAGWSVACWALIASLPVLLPLTAWVSPPSPAAGPKVFGAFLYLALISQLGGFFAWYRGLALGGIARVSQVQLLQLFMTVAIGAVLLGEAWDAQLLLFGGGVVASVAIATRLRAAPVTAPPIR